MIATAQALQVALVMLVILAAGARAQPQDEGAGTPAHVENELPAGTPAHADGEHPAGTPAHPDSEHPVGAGPAAPATGQAAPAAGQAAPAAGQAAPATPGAPAQGAATGGEPAKRLGRPLAAAQPPPARREEPPVSVRIVPPQNSRLKRDGVGGEGLQGEGADAMQAPGDAGQMLENGVEDAQGE